MPGSHATPPKKIAVLHGAGYTGRELIRLLLRHPGATLETVTSRTFAGKPIPAAHPDLHGQTELAFSDPVDLDTSALDAIFVAAEHGKSVQVVTRLLVEEYAGIIIDLSADFRLKDRAAYEQWYGFEHTAPALLEQFEYGLPEITAPFHGRWIANPGCFATGIALALCPLQDRLPSCQAFITACTGASGSGTRPKAVTHFPTRDGNVRAYKVLRHQHLPEVQQLLSTGMQISLVPASGPWTRGIWGTVQLSPPVPDADTVLHALYETYYAHQPLVRLWPGRLPELRYSVGTPFCDIGWVVSGPSVVIGFALDNLLKGAASQAVQNFNEVCGMPPAIGLVP